MKSRLPLPTEEQLERAAKLFYEKRDSLGGFSPNDYTKEIRDIFLEAGIQRFVFGKIDKPVKRLNFIDMNTEVVDFMELYKGIFQRA